MSDIESREGDNLTNIPTELMQFLKHDTYSLLIKGYAGTGKTTLALTILRALKIKKNFQYVSTRISPDQLYQYYPWIEEYFGKIGRIQLTESVEDETEMPIFVDARLDEPSSLFERITNLLMDVRTPVIVIDSWDAIGHFMDKEALMNNARVLQTWRERAKARLVFISEEPTDTTFDFLVDGIVELRQKYHNDRRIREIFLSKLRGVRIDKPSYIYTLNNSIFCSYKPYDPSEFVISANSTVRKHELAQTIDLLDGSYIRTGNSELDIALGGGFEKQGIVNVNIDSRVNAKIIMAFLSNIISNFVASGNPVLFFSSEALDPNYVTDYLKSHLSVTEKELAKTFFPIHNTKKSDNSIRKKQLTTFRESIRRARTKHSDKILLSIMDADTVQRFYGFDKANKELEFFMDFLKSNFDLSIIVSKYSQHNMQEYLSGISDISLRILEVNGTLFLQSDVPWSHLYAVVVDRPYGHPEIKLEPIV